MAYVFSTTRIAVNKCIYCLLWKPIAAFNREHVVQVAFGNFGSGTPVLDCVCTDCNGTLGDEIDRKIARDSLEALDRIRVGLKPAAAFKTEGKRSTLRVEFDKDGPLQGALGCHVPDPDGSQSLAVTPLPQIGFARSEKDEPDWFLIDALPTKEQLVERGFERGSEAYMRTWGIPIDDALEALKKKGFTACKLQGQVQPPTGRVRTEIVAKISDPEFRAVSKIAFNYLAFLGGPAVVLLPQFDPIRRYIRCGEKLPWESVTPGHNPWEITRNDTGAALVGHYIILKGDDQRGIEARVCLFNRVCYRIRLAAGGFPMPVTVAAGHLFDLEGRETVPLPVAEMPPFA